MSDEQELSMDEILTSIRRILSAELDGTEQKTPNNTVKKTQQENDLTSCSKNVFVLSDAMRVPERTLFSPSQLNTTHTLPKATIIPPQAPIAHSQMTAIAHELINQWLDKHLREITEEIVIKEVRTLLRRP